jgi:hypothetical protein
MTCAGRAYALPTSAPHTGGIDGSLLPTPVTTDAKAARNRTSRRKQGSAHHDGTTLSDALRLLPTPTSRDHKGQNRNHRGLDLPGAIDGLLLPTLSATNANDGEDLDQWAARRLRMAERHGNNGFGMPLAIAVRLLPTPRTTDRFGAGEHGDGGPDLRTVIGSLSGDRTAPPSSAGSGSPESPAPQQPTLWDG